jgi:hypothetical protein
VWVTSYLANSAGYAYSQAGVLDFTVTPSMIPPTIPIQLNTSSFAAVAPGLAKAHPNAAMLLQFNAQPTPVSTRASTAGMNVTLTFAAEFKVRLANGSDTPAFTLNTTTLAKGDVRCAQNISTKVWSVRFNLTEVALELVLHSTEFGPVDASSLQMLVDYVVQGIVLPQLNHAGSKGIPIPVVDGVQFVNPEIVFGPDWVRVDTDVKYIPSAARTVAVGAVGAGSAGAVAVAIATL